MDRFRFLAVLAGCVVSWLPVGCISGASRSRQFRDDLALLGHRNWVVIADSAYPAQSGDGLVTLYSGGDLLVTLESVLRVMREAGHVAPMIHLDQELDHVPEADAPGIVEYRRRLKELLVGSEWDSRPHAEQIDALDVTARKFQVLVIKTDEHLPYTSVFLELDCGYWDALKEQRLREALAPVVPPDAPEPPRRSTRPF